MKQKENRLGYESIPRLILSMSGPLAFSMFIQALYNIVDSIFVAQVGEEALAAISMTFPIQQFLIAISVGTGVGTAALLSQLLGKKMQHEANIVGQTGLFLSVISSLVFIFVGLFFSEPFFARQTTDPLIIQYGTDYMSIVCIFSVGLFIQVMTERLLQSTGNAFLSMVVQIVGAGLNIVLDPVFIFGLGPIPAMGVAGAAIATVLGQFAASIVGLFLNFKKNNEIDLFHERFTIRGIYIRRIYSVGVPSMVMMSIASVLIYYMNKILFRFSSTAVVAYGIFMRLQSFMLMPLFGMNAGLIPIVAYNYGAENKARIYETIKVAYIIGGIVVMIGFVLFQLVPSFLMGFFNPSGELLDMGITCLRITSIGFPFVFFPIINASLVQALEKGIYSTIISVIRQLIIILPAAYFLSLTGDVANVWFAHPIGEIVTAVVSYFFIRSTLREKVAPLPDKVY